MYRAEPDEDTDASDFCKQILKAEFEAVEVDDYQMGKHHLFLKEAFYQHVEQLRLNVSETAVPSPYKHNFRYIPVSKFYGYYPTR